MKKNIKNSGIVEKKVLQTRKKFSMKRWKELFENPPAKLYKYDGTSFRVDIDVFRKFLQYSYDMLFKNLDIFGIEGGIEGSGKSVDASQVGQQFYYIFTECNIINKELNTWYEYNEENCLAHNLIRFLELCDKYNDELFRIIICDEAGDLKGEDRWEEANKEFRTDMRKDRKKLRVRLMCYPNPWELVKDVTLGRTNFIRLNRFSSSSDGFGSIPDIVDTIIIPRGEYTYSFHTKEMIRRGEIKKALLELTKARYTTELDKKFIYKTSKKDDVFCFNAEEYIKRAKEENRGRKKQKKIYVSDKLIHIFAENLTAGKLGLRTKVTEGVEGEIQKKQYEEVKKARLVNTFVFTCKQAVKDKKKEDL